MNKWSRRALLAATAGVGGGFLVAAALRPGRRQVHLAPLVAQDHEVLVNAWVKVDAKNVTTVIVPHSEMGQGSQSALAQVVADEMGADWSLVQVQEAPAETAYANYFLDRGYLLSDPRVPELLVPTVEGLLIRQAQRHPAQVTVGSISVRSTAALGLRIAGAAAREMMLEAAAKRWKAPVAALRVSSSWVKYDAQGLELKFSELAQDAAKLTPPARPKLKSPSDFNLIGKRVPRLDLPAKVDGSAIFSIDVQRPNMLYAALRQAPVTGSRLQSFSKQAVESTNGVVKVLEVNNALAVVARSYWKAEQALNVANPIWADGPNATLSSAKIFSQFSTDLDARSGQRTEFQRGDTGAVFADAEHVVSAEYSVPYLAHVCMEPVNATVEFVDGLCHVYTGTQVPLRARRQAADALGLAEDQVVIHNQLMGGGFGRKTYTDWLVQAVLIARELEQPVKLLWSREQDVRHDFYRQAVVSRFRASVSKTQGITAWENTFVNRQGPYDAPRIPYSVQSQRIDSVASSTNVRTGLWRSVAHSQHGFFTESFADELAAAVSEDPMDFRLALLRDKPRLISVLRKAAELSGWREPLSSGSGQGVAVRESHGTAVAHVVRVSVAESMLVIDRVVVVVDPGLAVSPDGLAAQMESAVVDGLSAALFGEVTVSQGAVEQSNFHNYRLLRFSSAPVIDVHIINSGERWGGGGESGLPGVAPALVNAIYSATGQRIRTLPLLSKSQPNAAGIRGLS